MRTADTSSTLGRVKLNQRVPPAVVCALVWASATLLPAATAVAGPEAVIQISAILASRERGELDSRLAPLRHELRGLPFKGYTLLAVQNCRLEPGDQCSMDIPGGGFLHVITKESTAKHLKMRLLLNQQNRPVLNADIKLNRGAGILVKAARAEYGTIVLSVRCAGVGADAATAKRD